MKVVDSRGNPKQPLLKNDFCCRPGTHRRRDRAARPQPVFRTETKNEASKKTDVFDGNTVNGRNPAPVDMANIPLLTEFYTSQVVQDFFHQPYTSWWLNQPSEKNMLVKLGSSSPRFGVNIKNI